MGQEKANVAALKAQGGALSFKEYLYNSKTGEVLGRTGGGWLKLLVFYLIFYGWLAAFFAAMYVLFFTSIEITAPKYFNNEGLMRSKSERGQVTPGMGFRPMKSFDDTTLIIDKNNKETYTRTLAAFLSSGQPWDNASTVTPAGDPRIGYEEVDSKLTQDCVSNKGKEEDNMKPCAFPTSYLGVCKTGYAYGPDHLPCAIVKLNRIYGYEPVPFNCTSTDGQTPDDRKNACLSKLAEVSDDRENDIERELIKNHGDNWLAVFSGTQVIFTCDGTNPPDVENLRAVKWQGDSNDFPKGKIPAYFFPYTNQEGYLSPLGAVMLEVTSGVMVNVRCRAWSSDIITKDLLSREGAVMFELVYAY